MLKLLAAGAALTLVFTGSDAAGQQDPAPIRVSTRLFRSNDAGTKFDRFKSKRAFQVTLRLYEDPAATIPVMVDNGEEGEGGIAWSELLTVVPKTTAPSNPTAGTFSAPNPLSRGFVHLPFGASTQLPRDLMTREIWFTTQVGVLKSDGTLLRLYEEGPADLLTPAGFTQGQEVHPFRVLVGGELEIDENGRILDREGDVIIDDDVEIRRDLLVDEDLTVLGTTDLEDTNVNNLEVEGTVSDPLGDFIEVADGLDVSGRGLFSLDVDVGTDLTVGNSASVGNDLDVGDSLDVSGPGTFGGPVAVNNNLSVTGVITNPGGGADGGGDAEVTVDDLLRVTQDTSLQGNLDVVGGGTFGGATAVNNNLTVNGATTLNGATGINSSLNVSGMTTLDGPVDINNDVDVSGNISINGSTVIDDTGHWVGPDRTEGKDISPNSVNIATTLLVQGEAMLEGGAAVTNGLITDELDVVGAADIGGSATVGANLNVTGNTVTGSLNVNGDAAVGGNATVAGDTAIGGNATMTGSASVGGTLDVGGAVQNPGGPDVVVNDDLTVLGNAAVVDLDVTGQVGNSGAGPVNVQDSLFVRDMLQFGDIGDPGYTIGSVVDALETRSKDGLDAYLNDRGIVFDVDPFDASWYTQAFVDGGGKGDGDPQELREIMRLEVPTNIGMFDGKETTRADLYVDGNVFSFGLNFALTFPTRETDLEPGMVLAVDPHNPEHVVAAQRGFAESVLGVASNDAGFVMGGHAGAMSNSQWLAEVASVNGAMPGAGFGLGGDPLVQKIQPLPGQHATVAIAGRLPIQVDLSGGPIAAGDRLGLGTMPGIAARHQGVGPVVGIALGNWDGGSEPLIAAVHVQTVANPSGSVATWPAGTPIVDSGTIPFGAETITVQHGALNAASFPTMTMYGDVGSRSWIAEQGNGYFVIQLEAPAVSAVPFRYQFMP